QSKEKDNCYDKGPRLEVVTSFGDPGLLISLQKGGPMRLQLNLDRSRVLQRFYAHSALDRFALARSVLARFVLGLSPMWRVGVKLSRQKSSSCEAPINLVAIWNPMLRVRA